MANKTHAVWRTVTNRRGEGMRHNKPKHNWSKRRRRSLGWRV